MAWEDFKMICPRCKGIAELYGISFALQDYPKSLGIKVHGKCHTCDLELTHETDVEERTKRCMQLYRSHLFIAKGSEAVN